MLINESTLRKIIREEMANIDRGQKLITQDDEVDQQELGGGYSFEFGVIPGANN